MFQKTKQEYHHLPLTSGGFLSTPFAHPLPSTVSPPFPPPSLIGLCYSLHCSLILSPCDLCPRCSLPPEHFLHLSPTESSFLLKSSPIITSSGQLPLTFWTGDIPIRCSWSLTGLWCGALNCSGHHTLIWLFDWHGLHSTVWHMFSGIIAVSSCANLIPAPNTIPSTEQVFNKDKWSNMKGKISHCSSAWH